MKIKLLVSLIFSWAILSSVNSNCQVNWSWGRQADSSQNQSPTQIAVDRNNNVFATGTSTGTRMAFATNIGLNLTGTADDFLVKYDANGNALWSRNALVLSNSGFDNGFSVATDRSNNVLEVGIYSDSVAYGAYHLPPSASFSLNAFLVKYTPAGNVSWARSATNSPLAEAEGVAADKESNVYEAGFFDNTVKFGGTTLTSSASSTAYLVKYDAAGNVLWARAPSSLSFSWAVSVAVDDSGNAFIAGNFTNTLTLGSVTINGVNPFTDMFIAKYDSAGNVKWAIDVPADWAPDSPVPIRVDKTGNVYISGEFSQSTLTIGTSTITDGAGNGDGNTFLAKYDRNGNPLWATCAAFVSVSEVATIGGSSIATDFCNNVYWSGLVSDTFRIGSVSIAPTGSTSSSTFSYVIKLDSNGNALAGVGMLDDNLPDGYFTNGIAVDSLSKVLFTAGLDSPPTLTLGSDVITQYQGNPTAFFTKFSLGTAIVSANINQSDSICLGDSITLKVAAQQGVTYLWNTGATADSITVKPTITTNYFVAITNCFTDTSFTKVTVLPSLTPTITGLSTICSGDSTLLTGSGGGNYKWSTGQTTSILKVAPLSTTSYTLTVSNSKCSATTSMTVTVSLPVTTGESRPHDTICPGIPITLTSPDAGGGPVTYLWSNGATSPSINVRDSNSTRYIVTITGACKSIQDTINVPVTPTPLPDFRADIKQGCVPLCVQFRDMSSIPTGSITSRLWTFGNGDTAHTINPIYCYQKTGSYDVTIMTTSATGCSATLVIDNFITVFDKPVANFIYSPQPISALEPTVQFTDKSTDTYGITYRLWNFGEPGDTASMLQNPSHTYGDTGTYCASLIVLNNKGCADSITNCLVINPIFTLYIPDAFSPNGNGKNDVFEAKGNDIKTFEMYIFDRWGMELFHSTDINDAWNGTAKGGTVICQQDTYVYVINVTDHKNIRHSYNGVVTLIK